MEEHQINAGLSSNQLYNYAADLFVNQDKNSYDVRMALIQQGASEADANHIIEKVEEEIDNARRSAANKDMLYGGLWVAGGLILTVAEIGFIFWGAILFGGIQFAKGAMNAIKN
ncbi:hypothetical protein J2X31_001097 [Flavobacterium arsenatis]|uniref:Uncharacterized protein n=1 Tax=Flavobacterium arsenatis TaxID=1484332 RepID=A0ABU1TM97_9FLAO|nr:hypothetical protein [Flavobacterium arsenatis]MDR6967090.1 hypothetical protein [Flavobacterium arsenatis]